MKYDKYEAIIIFTLMFNDGFVSSKNDNILHSPDYVIEKFNQCFSINIDNIKPFPETKNEYLDKYCKQWRIVGKPDNILNIVAWLLSYELKSYNIDFVINQFNHFICDTKYITVNDPFMIMHPVLKKAIDRVLSEWSDKSVYINSKRRFTISEIESDEV